MLSTAEEKEGFFDETTLPKGEIKVAVKFADMLTPNPPTNLTPISKLDAKQLPRPTEDVDQVRRDIKEWGYGLVANAMSAREIHVMQEALRQQAAGEVENGCANRGKFLAYNSFRAIFSYNGLRHLVIC